MVKSPVLFETYIRVDTARVVWERIKDAKPQKLYFYSNKALEDRPEDIKKNNEIRSWVNEVDWECDVHTFFRDSQVDVYTSLLSSKKWLFEHEECGIILEDDCVPSKGFFQYCDHFLDIYKNNKKIFCISGDNYTNYTPNNNIDHIISRKGNVYGWATWKDRFESVDFNMTPSKMTFKDFRVHFAGLFPHAWSQYMFYQPLESFIDRTHCWDFEWGLAAIKSNRYFVMPVRHLVQNIGTKGEHFNGDAKNNVIFTMPVDMTSDYVFVSQTRCEVKPDNSFDKLFFKARWPIMNILKSYIKYRIKSIMGRCQ